jgi:hypothetical protein
MAELSLHLGKTTERQEIKKESLHGNHSMRTTLFYHACSFILYLLSLPTQHVEIMQFS